MNRKVYEDALYAVNFAREAKGLPALERLPSGRRCFAYECPMAKALDPAIRGASVYPDSGVYGGGEDDWDLRRVISPEVMRFAVAFDADSGDMSMLPGTTLDPATLVPEYREQVPEVKAERAVEGAK